MEAFDRHKLRACLMRVAPDDQSNVCATDSLSSSVECYMLQRSVRTISSAAVLEMALAALHAVGLKKSAYRLERHYCARERMRSRLMVVHEGGIKTAWSKDWLAENARSQWALGRTAARILAGRIEEMLLARRIKSIARKDIMKMLGRLVVAYGLIIPCPLEAGARK
jgi:hypothetical protein